MSYLRDFLRNKMDDDTMEEFTGSILHQKFDEDTKTEWEQVLREQYGVQRKKKSAGFAGIFTLRRVAAVAAVVALLIVSFIVLTRNTLPEQQQVAQSYIEELPIMADQLNFRKGDVEVDQIRLSANEAYIAEDFETAITKWELLYTNQQATPYDLFYLGVSYLKQQSSEPEKTIDLLLQAQPQAPSLRQEINWVLSLAYVRFGQVDQALPILEGIVADEEYMSEAAGVLLEGLK